MAHLFLWGHPFLSPEHRLELLERIRARHKARITAGPPPDAMDPEEAEEVEEKKKESKDVGESGEADLQAEQQIIYDSLRSESDAEARRRRRQEMEA